MKQVTHGSPVTRAHQEDAEKREKDAHGGDDHRGDDRLELHLTVKGKGRGTQCSRGEYRSAVALVQVGAHAGHVAHIIAYIIGDGSRIAWIILGDVGFHLAHKVCSDIGRLGVDTATHTGEQSLRGSTHSEGEHRGGDGDQCGMLALIEGCEDEKPEGDVEQAEADHNQAHDRTRAERHTQTAVQPLTGSIGCTTTGVSSCLHAKETTQAREEATGEKGKRYPRILHMQSVGHECKQQGQDDEDNEYNLVLLTQISHGTLAYMRGYLTHARCAFVGFHH